MLDEHENRSVSAWLAAQLAERQDRRPTYSLRCFAKHLDLSPSHLANLISGRRTLTPMVAQSIGERMDLSPDETRDLLKLVPNRRNPLERDVSASHRLDGEVFKLISDWHHMGLLSLARTVKNSSDPENIARELRITKPEATQALDRLQKLGLLAIENGALKCLTDDVVTSNDVPSAAIRRHHRQVLQKAERALENVEMDRRQVETSTIAMSTARIAEIKAAVSEFHDKIKAIAATDETKDTVYNLAVQFFPANS